MSPHPLKVPGATLHHEVRGSGPVLLLLPGGATDSAPFARLAVALSSRGAPSSRYTVVTYDPRGLSASPLDGPARAVTVPESADDAHRLLGSLDAGPAFVLAAGAGALVGLDLVARHPAQVRLLVAHEPPAVGLLPDAAAVRADARRIREVFRRDGVDAALAECAAGVDPAPWAAPDPHPPDRQRLRRNTSVAFTHLWDGLEAFEIDLDALRDRPVVVGIGRESVGQPAFRGALALAERLGLDPVGFPGGHTGFADRAEEFAVTLHGVLSQVRAG